MISRYADWVVKNSWLCLAITVLVISASTFGMKNLTLTAGYSEFFDKDNPQLLAFDRIKENFANSDGVLIMVSPQSGDVFSAETLTAIAEITEEAWQLPYAQRADSITNFQHVIAEGDDLLVDDLIVEPAQLTHGKLSEARDVAIEEPLLYRRLISADASVAAINVTLNLPEISTISEVPEVASAVRALRDRYMAKYPDLSIRLTGISMLNNAFNEESRKDARTLLPLMFFVVVVTLGMMLRMWAGTVASVAVIVASILVALGLFGWGGWHLTSASLAAPIIILTMAVADCVHILVAIIQQMMKGLLKRDAIRESIRVNMMPVFVTSLTTAIGYLTMNASEVPPFRDLGNLVAIGVVAAFFFSIFSLPALMSVLPVHVKKRRTSENAGMQKLANFVIENRRFCHWGTVGVTLFMIAAIPGNEINDEFVNYFSEAVEFRQDADYAAENLSGIYSLEYAFQSGKTNGVNEVAFLGDVERFSEWLRDQSYVDNVVTITDTFKRLNKVLNGGDPRQYRLPESRELASQYLVFYEMSLPFGLDMTNQLNFDKSATRVTVTLKNVSSSKLLQIEDDLAAWLNVNTTLSVYDMSSPSSMFAHIGYMNTKSMILTTAIAMVLISIILVFFLRSLQFGLISIVPNMIPIIVTFGLWSFISGDVGISLTSAVGMVLGIVVDDTVHFLSKYIRARKEQGLSKENAVRSAFDSVGTALWVTSFVMIAGFVILGCSSFGINSDRGIFATIGIATALLVQFIFVPTVLIGRPSKSLPLSTPVAART